MQTFTQFLCEAGNGDCLDTAGRAVCFFGLRPDGTRLMDAIKNKGGTVKNIRLVHALVHGQGPVAGKRFVHAWVEVNGTVFDFSNGNSAVVPRDAYYAVGGVQPDEKGTYVKYTQKQAIKKISSTHHWGPWDINLDLEVLETVSQLDPSATSLYEAKNILPKTKAQIGKHKVRITKGDMNDLENFF